jgi:hypothetical protein
MAYITVAQLVRRCRLLLNEQLNALEIQEALDQIVRERFIGHQWSFAKDSLQFNTVAEVTTGTVAITQNTTAVTGTGTAFDTTNDVGRLFEGPDGEPYEISAVATTTALTLKDPYAGADVTAGTYAIRQAVYTLDSSVEQVLTMGGQEWQMYEITDDLLLARDVDRDVTGQPYYWRYVDPASDGSVRVELHPTPTGVQRVPYIGLLRGTAASRDTNIWEHLFGVLVNGTCGLGAMMIAARQEDRQQVLKWREQSEFYHDKFGLTLIELKRRDLDLYGRDEARHGLAYAYRGDPGMDLGPWYD